MQKGSVEIYGSRRGAVRRVVRHRRKARFSTGFRGSRLEQ